MISPHPRLVLAERLARRDSLHGVWRPYTTDIQQELVPMLAVAKSRFGAVFGIRLNQDEWTNSSPSWEPPTYPKTRVSWYGVQEAHTAVLQCGQHTRVVLLVLPPGTEDSVAVTATLLACRPGNTLTADEALEKARESAAHPV